ncbi:MAG: dihydroorotate dehydrogenase-like protein [Xanthobacteraceae bacterium]
MSNLKTRYMGLTLKAPLVASGARLCDSSQSIARLEDQGIAAVVLPSLFEEQLGLETTRVQDDVHRGAESFYESLRFFPDLQNFKAGPERYLNLIRDAKKRVDIPVIASLNGQTRDGWIEYAKLMEEAGADAIELNVYSIVTDPKQTAEQVERDYLELVSHLKKTIRVPLAVKLSPFFTAPANFGLRLTKAGADALVLFSRVCESDFDIEDREIITSLKVNPPDELRVRLHWTAILHGQIDADLAVAGGIRSERDIVKCIMAGARVAFTASALLQNGVEYANRMLAALSTWLDDHGYVSVEEMCGSMSYGAVPDPTTYQRGDRASTYRPYDL